MIERVSPHAGHAGSRSLPNRAAGEPDCGAASFFQRAFVNRLVFLGILLWTNAVFAGPVSAVFPAMNGSLPADTGGNSSVLAVGGAASGASWMSFSTRSFDTGHLSTAILLLPVKSVRTGGLCGVHALMTPVNIPEIAVRAKDLHYDDLPIAATTLDSSFTDGMLLLNITDQVRSRSFYGVLIRPMGRLSAMFQSRKAVPSPAIICVRETAGMPLSGRWFTGKERPDPSLGRAGDFYTQAVRGIVYRKSAASWDSVLTLTPPPPAPVVAPKTKKPKTGAKPKTLPKARVS